MPDLKRLRDEMSVARAVERERSAGDRRRMVVKTALACVAWMAIGVYLLAWSMHTRDVDTGRMFFYAGIGIGNGGILFTLVYAYAKGERRGHW
jgi:hypothetical protein